MESRRISGGLLLTLGILGACIVFTRPDDVWAEAPRCNGEPVATIDAKVYYLELAGTTTTIDYTGQVVPKTYNIRFDATAKSANKCLTDGSGTITWSVTPSTALQDLHRGNNPFGPIYSIKQDGVVTVKASLDGVDSNTLTIKLGTGQGTTPGTGTIGSGEERCAYKDKDQTICIASSVNDLNCDEAPECKTKTCNRVDSSSCSSGGPAFVLPLPVPVRDTPELGQLIENIYLWSISIVGFLVFVVFFYSGFTWLITAAGDPGKIKASQDRMWNAVWGALLLFSAYIILRVINPDLVRQEGFIPALPKAASAGAPAQPLPVVK